jgi:hypothetical protein
LLIIIFAFAFFYRLLLMLWQGFPSGSDIGLHNSVIYSITQSGNTNFFWNFFQIGGGLSLTFPGYHLFTAGVILMTGMSDYIAQAVVSAFFSSCIVLAAYLLTRRIWSESAAFIVAFLVAISRFDIEMLLWGGYPNVVTLLLIPLTFYLYLQKDRFTIVPFLASTSIFVASMFLTHSLSAGLFVGIVALAVLFIAVSPKTFRTNRKTCLYWLLPIFLGMALVSPFLKDAIPAYLQQNSALGVKGVSDITFAILSTRILPLIMVLPLFLVIAGFLVFSKKYSGKYLTLSSLLLCSWLFVPLFLTQGYLFKFIIDYNRFLYYIILPLLLFSALLIDHAAGFFAKVIDNYRTMVHQLKKEKPITHKKLAWISSHSTRKALYGTILLLLLVFCLMLVPIFMTPSQDMGEKIQSYYQAMTDSGWQAVQWMKTNTPTNSVFVADALYGWWMGGFAQRATLSAVDPQYLTLARELPIAKNASYILDTDYLIDNGLVQVREDGGYIARHNPEILADLNWTYFPYSFFTFSSDQTKIQYRVDDGGLQSVFLDELPVKDMRLESFSDHKTIVVVRGNALFNYTQYTTVTDQSAFVNLTSTITSVTPTVAIERVNIEAVSKGTQIYNDSATIAFVDQGVKAFGQLIYRENQPSIINVYTDEDPILLELEYTPQTSTAGEIQILASAYSVSDTQSYYKNDATISKYFNPIIQANLKSTEAPQKVEFKEVFDYRNMLEDYSVSYVVCRVPDIYPKFSQDPQFSLVFINKEVETSNTNNNIAIFKVNTNLSQNG